MAEATGETKTDVLLSGNSLKRLRRRSATKQSSVCDRVQLAREYVAYAKAGLAEGQVRGKVIAKSSKAEFIRTVLYKSNKRATADNKSISKYCNVLNRGIRELAKAGGGVDGGIDGLPAELLHGGKRGRHKKTEAEKQTPQHLMTCFRAKQGKMHQAMVLREALYEWFIGTIGSVVTTTSPHFMLGQARHMAGVIV